jgi:hypothetical protein
MNIPDYCPRARELYAEYEIWRARFAHGLIPLHQGESARAYRAWQEHLEDCELCEKDGE